MKIEEISFRNIASYGGQLQQIIFDKKQSHLYLVLGGNGYGKSTIATAIIFALYGQVDELTLADLPNRINKNLYVKIKLQCNGKSVVIERGLTPKLFKAEVNGVPLDQAGIANVQEYLETEVFEMPYRVFKNVIILSVNDFKSFLTMTPKDKRLIIDKLFGFSAINDMLLLLKKERKELNDSILSVESELTTISQSIEATSTKLSELEKISTKENQKKIEKLKSDLLKLKNDYDKLNSAKTKLESRAEELSDEIDEKSKTYNTTHSTYTSAQKKIKLYENECCPECGKTLDTEFDNNRKVEFEEIVKISPVTLKEIEDEIKSLKTQSFQNRENQNIVIGKISSIGTTIENLKKELLSIANMVKSGDGEFSHLKSLISEFKENEEDKFNMKSSLNSENYFLSVIENMLGDEGVKNLAIKTILPGLNATIAQMVNEMHLSFHIRFDEKFNCIINHLGEDINPKTLSTGERKKADFIVVIALIKLLKLRFPQLNLLFLDEIFSSIDHDGIYSILKILSTVIKENELNTFVINHTVLPQEIFDKKIEIFKDNGFSKFTVESIR
jgi:DNA repair exonuclease SbcCD ATPase subunit